MDSLTHVVLGAAIGVAVMGRRAAGNAQEGRCASLSKEGRCASLWKAAGWGAVANTLPDLDVFIDHGDPIADMVLHRGPTHALFWLTLASLPLALAVARLHGEGPLWKRWWLMLWLALIAHPLIDTLTVYGTRLALPFTDHPYGVGSVFIIDPLVTLPLLAGTGIALATRRLRANALGLLLCGAYLAWGVAAQQHVRTVAGEVLAAQGIRAERVLVTPTAFNSVLWRVVAVQREQFHEGFYSLLDRERTIAFDRFERGAALDDALQGSDAVRRIAAFSRGFYKLSSVGDRVLLTDLRMGQEPHYTFAFAIAQMHSPPVPVMPIVQVGSRPDLRRALPWLWRRLWGEPLAPPR